MSSCEVFLLYWLIQTLVYWDKLLSRKVRVLSKRVKRNEKIVFIGLFSVKRYRKQFMTKVFERYLEVCFLNSSNWLIKIIVPVDQNKSTSCTRINERKTGITCFFVKFQVYLVFLLIFFCWTNERMNIETTHVM